MTNQAATEVKRALSDPAKLCAALGLEKGSKRQHLGLFVLCPVHGERSPSCSVTAGEDGTIRVRCFGCDFTGDALTLIGVVRGLGMRAQFREVLLAGAEIAGLHALADEIRQGKPVAGTPAEAQPRAPEAPIPPERTYPPASEVAALWGACVPVDEHPDASFELVRRRVDPAIVATLDLARALPEHVELPWWARYRGQTWQETGHRMLLPVFDSDGKHQSVRAYRVPGNVRDMPKRLPPAGHKAVGLVLANGPAALVLSGARRLFSLVVVEGEPDFLVWASRAPDEPVIGLFSGSWHEGFAARIPYGAEIVVRTHHDRPGQKYSDAVVSTVRGRAIVRRSAA